MVKLICYDYDGNPIEKLTQWDFGQTVGVEGATYEGTPVFHFCNKRSYQAYTVESKNVDGRLTAEIPNILLQDAYPIEAYMYYQKNEHSAKTVYMFSIPVVPRKQPAGYVYNDNLDYVNLVEIKKEMMAALEELRATIQESKDSIVQVTTVIDEAKAATQEATSASASANAAAETAAQATTDARTAAQEAGHATEAATQAATAAGQATTSATNAAQSATDAANKANTAAGRVDTAIQDATTAAGNANTTAESATTAAGKADAATTKANDAANAATGASEKANAAAAQATDSAKTATDATATATSAASKADDAATAANEASAKATQAATEAITAKNEAATAATTATEAAGRADTATQGANTAAEAANAAAKAANDAAEKAKIDVAGKLDKPTAAPKVNDVLKVESVNPDGSFNAVWSEPPATVVVDETLQNAGQAADAAKTGEELKKLDKNKENVIVKSAFGESIALDDSGEAPLASIKLFGKTTQDGTPTPDTPVPLVSPGDDGNIGVSVTGKNLFDVSTVEVGKAWNGGANSARAVAHITLIPDCVYTLSYVNNASLEALVLCLKDKASSSSVIRFMDIHGTSVSFQAKRGENVLCVQFNKADVSLDDARKCNVQLELGSSTTTYEPYSGGSITIPTPNGLPGIKVSAGGNYTDATGQQWVCDEVDLERGVYVQRIGKINVFEADVQDWGAGPEGMWDFRIFMELYDTDVYIERSIPAMCNKFARAKALQPNQFSYSSTSNNGWGGQAILHFRVSDKIKTVPLFKEYVGKDCIALFKLKDEKCTHLSPELIAAYRALHTNFPNTNILNDEGCEMSVSYFTDTEVGKYIGGLSRSSVRTDPATKSPVTLGYDDGGLYIMTE